MFCSESVSNTIKSKRAYGGHANHKKWYERKKFDETLLTSRVQTGWVGGKGGDRALAGLSGAAHLQKPLRSVYVCGMTLCFLCQALLGPARQNWDQVSSGCSGGPSPVDA